MEGKQNIEVSTSAILYDCCCCKESDECFRREYDDALKEQLEGCKNLCGCYLHTLTISLVFLSWLSYVVAYNWMSVLLPDAKLALTYWLSQLFLTGIVGVILSFLALVRWNKYYMMYFGVISMAKLTEFSIYLTCIICALPYYYAGIYSDLWSGFSFGAGFGTLLGVIIVSIIIISICVGSCDSYHNAKKKLIEAEIEKRNKNNVVLNTTANTTSPQQNQPVPVIVEGKNNGNNNVVLQVEGVPAIASQIEGNVA